MDKTDIEKYSEQLAEIFPDLNEQERLKVLDRVYNIRRFNVIKDDFNSFKENLNNIKTHLNDILKNEFSKSLEDKCGTVSKKVKNFYDRIRNSNT